MPLYTVLTEEGSVPDQTKARIAEDLTNNIPKEFWPQGRGRRATRHDAAGITRKM